MSVDLGAERVSLKRNTSMDAIVPRAHRLSARAMQGNGTASTITGRFAPFHRWDRSFFLGATLAIWTVLVAGFGYDLVTRARLGMLDFPWIVHLHALVYTGWIVLLALQVGLVRTRRLALHRRLGRLGALLIPAMIVLGPATAIVVRVTAPHPVWQELAFMGTQFANVLGAGAVLIAGLLTVRHPSTHKRLMIMGTIGLTEPGFGRLLYPTLYAWFGEGYLPYYLETYAGTLVLVLAAGGYDLATRHRLHPAWALSAVWIVANQCLGTWLFYEPWWLRWMAALTGH